MELQEILSIAIGALVTVVIAHFAVFYTVRYMYPPTPATIPQQVVMTPQPPPPAYIPPPVVQQETHVELPTYAPSVSVEAPREERKGPPAPESTSIRGKSGLDTPNAQ